MLFNTLDFLLFFLIIFVAYWSIPNKFKWILLLICSYFFYAYWNPIYILLLFISTAIDYFLSLYLTSSLDIKRRKLGLYLSLFLNFGLLFSFKYYNFFTVVVNSFLGTFSNVKLLPELSIILPVGISFYTFQTVSYSIDVYRRDTIAERNFGKFALYISFFPQLVAGPIERVNNLLPQIKEPFKTIDSSDFYAGIRLIIWGLFLKVVVGDNLADLVSPKFGQLSGQSGGALLFALILFAFQLYTDFNGYSKMAMGLARLLGYRLMNNFNYPLISSSFNEFWKRWHISLSQWIRDYIYIPIGGSRSSTAKTCINLLVAFMLSGLWHGASFNFLFWGFLCGALFVSELLLSKFIFDRIHWWKNFKWVNIFFVFGLFCLSLVPFRTNSFQDTITVYGRLSEIKLYDLYFWFADNRYSPGMLGLYIVVFIEIWFGLNLNSKINLRNKYTNYLFFIVLFFMIILLGRDSGSQFIYFVF